MVPEVRINLTKIKAKSLKYFQKAAMIIKMNFEEHIKQFCPRNVPPPINPFTNLYNLYKNTSSSTITGQIESFYKELSKDSFYGNNRFSDQLKLHREIMPVNEESDSDNGVDSLYDDASDLDARVGEEGNYLTSSMDSNSQTNSDDLDDMNSEFEESQHVEVRVASIQEWLFKNNFPTFGSKQKIESLV